MTSDILVFSSLKKTKTSGFKDEDRLSQSREQMVTLRQPIFATEASADFCARFSCIDRWNLRPGGTFEI